MKYIFLIILTTLIIWIGKTLAMILMYASPDNVPHTFHASIYVLASSIFAFSFYYNIKNTIHIAIKWILTIIGVSSALDIFVLSYLAMFSERVQDEIDIKAAFVFLIAGLLISLGTFFMLKNTKQRIINE